MLPPAGGEMWDGARRETPIPFRTISLGAGQRAGRAWPHEVPGEADVPH